MSDLIQDNKLYDKLYATMQNFKVNTIYEPDKNGPFGDCYCAAIDLFEPGCTFKVYFKEGSDGEIIVVHIERWYFG